MEKLTISQASKQFGISRARLYQLLDKGVVVGYKGHGDSWISTQSLDTHIKTRDKRRYQGRPTAEVNGDFLPARIAAQRVGYTTRHINYLIKQGNVAAKKAKGGMLIYYPSLLNYIQK